MAKITITLRDEPGGHVSVKTDCLPPPSDQDAVATPAQCEAIALLTWLGERAEEFGGTLNEDAEAREMLAREGRGRDRE